MSLENEELEVMIQDNVYGAEEHPIWIDEVWLDTVVVVGLTCFILCLMGLSKVRSCVCVLLLLLCD